MLKLNQHCVPWSTHVDWSTDTLSQHYTCIAQQILDPADSAAYNNRTFNICWNISSNLSVSDSVFRCDPGRKPLSPASSVDSDWVDSSAAVRWSWHCSLLSPRQTLIIVSRTLRSAGSAWESELQKQIWKYLSAESGDQTDKRVTSDSCVVGVAWGCTLTLLSSTQMND